MCGFVCVRDARKRQVGGNQSNMHWIPFGRCANSVLTENPLGTSLPISSGEDKLNDPLALPFFRAGASTPIYTPQNAFHWIGEHECSPSGWLVSPRYFDLSAPPREMSTTSASVFGLPTSDFCFHSLIRITFRRREHYTYKIFLFCINFL